jgi:MFS family permease
MRDYLAFVITHRRFLAFGVAMAFFSSFGQTFFVALFGGEIREAFGLSHTRWGLLYSLATLASGTLLIKVGRTIDHVDLRAYSSAVCGGLVVACLLMAAVVHPLMLLPAIFMVRLSGQGLLSHTAMTSMARYFDEGRGKAMSIAALGFPLGEAAVPLITVMAINALGWRQTWLTLAAVLAAVLIPLSLWLLRGHTRRHAQYMERLAAELSPGSGRASHAGAEEAESRQWARRDVLRDRRFYLILPAVIAPAFIVTGIFFHQVHLVEAKAWDLKWFAACFVAFASAQLPASLLSGPLVDRLGATTLFRWYLAPLGLALLVLASSDHPAAALVFMVLAGATSGLGGTVVGSLWPELYGTLHLGAIRAMITALMVYSTAVSPFSMGWLIDLGVSMETIALACVIFSVFATISAIAALRRRPPP